MSKHDYGVSRWQLGDLSSPIRGPIIRCWKYRQSYIQSIRKESYTSTTFFYKRRNKRSKVLTLAATIMTRYNNECTNLLLLLHTIVAAFNRTKYSERSRTSLEESEFLRRRCYSTQGKHDSKVL